MRKVDLELKHGFSRLEIISSLLQRNQKRIALFVFPAFLMMKSHFSECFLRTWVAFPIDKEWCKELQEATLDALTSLKQAIQTAIHTKILNHNSLLEAVHPEAFKATLERSEISSFLLECV